MGRYDWIYELRPVPVKARLLEEVSRRVAEDLAHWPPPIEAWLSAQEAARFAAVMERPAPPGPRLMQWALHLSRLELERAFDAVDYELRNERWRALGGTEADRDAVLLVVRWLTELLLEVKARSAHPLTRADLVDVVDRVAMLRDRA